MTFRIRIHHDASYAFQSHSSLDLWTKAGWTEVSRILPLEVGKDIASRDRMSPLELRLIDAAQKILAD